MIPDKIHYCWFGGRDLPEDAQRCIESWRRYFPGYEICRWDESNFDVDAIPYTREAYAAGKYAFVSDFARFWILHREGGVYFDTDVEVVRDMRALIGHGAYMGCEIDGGQGIAVNPGLGAAVEAGHPMYAEIIDFYRHHNFRQPDGGINPYAVVRITTDTLIRHGLLDRPGKQTVDGINIYPAEYFNPLDDATGRLHRTDRTYSIHWYSKTWLDVNPMRQRLSRMAHRMLGKGFFTRFRR